MHPQNALFRTTNRRHSTGTPVAAFKGVSRSSPYWRMSYTNLICNLRFLEWRVDTKIARCGIVIFSVTLLLAGCTTVQVKQTRYAGEPVGAPRIEPNQAVAILTFAAIESSLETEAVGCVSQSINTAHPNVRVMTADEFRRTVFSYRIPDDEAERTKYLNLMMAQPAIRERMISLGIRYLIILHGKTDMKASNPMGFGGASGGYGGYVLFATWDRKTNLAASFLDVTESRLVGDLHSSASGKPWLFSAQIIFTIGAPAFTEQGACRGLGEAVAKFLAGENPEEASKNEDSPKN